MKTASQILNDAISSVCPVDGVSVGYPADKSTWRVDYSPSATPEQLAAANTIIDSFDIETAIKNHVLISAVNDLRDQKFVAGYTDATTGKTYPCDPISLPRWTAIEAASGLAMVMNATPTFDVITADNSIITLSAADAFALFHGRVMPWFSVTAIFARKMKDAIIAGKAPADLTLGWP